MNIIVFVQSHNADKTKKGKKDIKNKPFRKNSPHSREFSALGGEAPPAGKSGQKRRFPRKKRLLFLKEPPLTDSVGF